MSGKDDDRQDAADGEGEEKEQLPMETAVLIIKPHAVSKKISLTEGSAAAEEEDRDDDDDESEGGKGGVQLTTVTDIVRRLAAEGFTVVQQRRVQISSFQAMDICSKYSRKKYYEDMIIGLTASPLVALQVSKRGEAIESLGKLVGRGEDPEEERKLMADQATDKELWTFRATYGVNTVFNSVMCSSDKFSRDREMSILFPKNEGRTVTCCIIKPDAMLPKNVTVQEGVGTVERAVKPWEEIKATIEANGFVILAERDVNLKARDMSALFPQSVGDDYFVDDVIPHMTNGRVTAIAIEGVDAVVKWQLLMGPSDPKSAKIVAPKSLRAKFGQTNLKNAVAGSLSNDDADRQLRHLFPDGFQVERTLAIIKPAAVKLHLEAILEVIRKEGFSILAQQRVQLSRARAELFYIEQQRRALFPKLTQDMSAGPVHILLLAKPGAIRHWRRLMGPTNSNKARIEAPGSLRALYGVDGTQNAVHGSDSAATVNREAAFFFPLMPRRAKVGTAAQARKFLSAAPAGEGTASRTLHSVVIEGLTALCRVKPKGLDAVRWLGKWFLEHNPNRPRVDEPEDMPMYSVSEPDAEDEDTKAAGSTAEAKVAVAATYASDDKDAAVAPETQIVFVLGGPGTGKTTVCERVAKEFKYESLSTSKLLKLELERGTPLGLEIKEAMSRGELVPLESVLRVLKMAIQRSAKHQFVIDGYPRQLSQAFAFEQQVCPVQMVLYLDLAEDKMRQRLSQGDGADAETITKRMVVYRDFCRPVVSLYKKLGRVVHVEAEQDIESVWAQVQAAFVKQVVFVVGGPEARVGEVCRAMSSRFGFERLAIADLVKKEVASGSRVGTHLASLTKGGRVVPDELTMQLLRQALELSASGKFIVEGFPRSLSEAIHFEEHIGSCTRIVDVKCPATVQRQRLRARYGGSVPRRAAVRFEKLLAVYEGDTLEAVDFYQRCGLVATVNGDQPEPAVIDNARQALLPNVYFVVGGPGAGTSDLCARAARDLGLTHLNVGALLRAEIARGSEVGQHLDRLIRSGQIVPVESTLQLLQNCFNSRTSSSGAYLIDEWPRALDQAKAFEKRIAQVTRVVYLRAEPETLRTRATEMDNDRFERRMALFNTQTLPVVDYFAHRGVVDTIDIEMAKDPEQLFQTFKTHFTSDVVLAVAPPSSGVSKPLWSQVESEFGFKRVSTEELMAAEHQRGTATGKLLRQLVAANKLVPAQLMLRLLQNVLGAAGGNRFVVEGFPRDLAELATFRQMVGDPRFCVHLQQGKDAYLASAPTDSDPQQREKQFDQFRAQLTPLLQNLGEAGQLRRVNASNATSPDVFQQVRRWFMPRVTLLVGCAGSGRSEVATYLGRNHSFARIHITALLRAEAKSGSEEGAAIARCFKMQRTVPHELLLPLILRECRRLGRSDILLDGYPRLVSWSYPLIHDQAFALDAVAHVQRVIILKSTKQDKLKRCTNIEEVETSERTMLREKMPGVEYYKQSTIVPVLEVWTNDQDLMKKQLEKAMSITAPLLD